MCFSFQKNYNLFSFNLLQAKTYLRQLTASMSCTCGDVVSVNVPRAVQAANIKSVSHTSLRQYVKQRGIGCTGKNMRLTTGQNVTCLHISKSRMPAELLAVLDGGNWV